MFALTACMSMISTGPVAVPYSTYIYMCVCVFVCVCVCVGGWVYVVHLPRSELQLAHSIRDVCHRNTHTHTHTHTHLQRERERERERE